MNFTTPYFLTYTSTELEYYKSVGVYKDPDSNFLPSKFLKDLEKGLLSEEVVKEVVSSLTPTQKEELYEMTMETLDPFGPEESMMELLDLLDPEYSYFN
jgi:hypothetical protein